MTEANAPTTADTRPPTLAAGTKTYYIVAVISLGLLAGLGAIAFYSVEAQTRATLMTLHGPALIGTPFAILVATILVSDARAVDGQLSGSLLGVELRGAAATLLAWLLAFLAVVFAIRVLW